jgi:hypothetical protein
MNTQTQINVNSSQNQKIKGKLVERDVYALATHLVEYILSHSFDDNPRQENEAPFTIDDIQNMYIYPEYFGAYANFEGGSEEELNEEIERLKEIEIKVNPDNKELVKVQEDIAELESLEEEPQEIFEWWIVSKWLGNRLEAEGEPVINDGVHIYWGRTCTGQAILLDSVISQIAYDLEILEGQANEWKV